MKILMVIMVITCVLIGCWSECLALVTPALEAVTETSYKYVDLAGNIHFAVSHEAVPAQFVDPRWMSGSIEQETDNHSQQIGFLDVDGDNVSEILVTITTIYPTLREETTVEIIKPVSTYYLNLVTVVECHRLYYKISVITSMTSFNA